MNKLDFELRFLENLEVNDYQYDTTRIATGIMNDEDIFKLSEECDNINMLASSDPINFDHVMEKFWMADKNTSKGKLNSEYHIPY